MSEEALHAVATNSSARHDVQREHRVSNAPEQPPAAQKPAGQKEQSVHWRSAKGLGARDSYCAAAHGDHGPHAVSSDPAHAAAANEPSGQLVQARQTRLAVREQGEAW